MEIYTENDIDEYSLSFERICVLFIHSAETEDETILTSWSVDETGSSSYRCYEASKIQFGIVWMSSSGKKTGKKTQNKRFTNTSKT